MRGATYFIGRQLCYKPISIHAPHAGCDATFFDFFYVDVKFQSTHPMRGATRSASSACFSPRISIHAPHAGCDPAFRRIRFDSPLFQSTHPMRGATQLLTAQDSYNFNFNPRTPCGVRLSIFGRTVGTLDFNPRTPCGVRRFPSRRRRETGLFQSTHPMRGATIIFVQGVPQFAISIHAPHAGCDSCAGRYRRLASVFQSTHPMRGATQSNKHVHGNGIYFNPRTPCGVRRFAPRGSV